MELKFRAWCKENLEWIQINKMGFWDDGALWYLEDYEKNEPPYFTDRNDWVLSQYTGLQDKNGKDIYEGDIVKGVGWLDKNEVYVVEFGNGEYYLEAPEGADYEYYNGDCPHGDRVDNWYESEVIGNIYDNPELIGA